MRLRVKFLHDLILLCLFFVAFLFLRNVVKMIPAAIDICSVCFSWTSTKSPSPITCRQVRECEIPSMWILSRTGRWWMWYIASLANQVYAGENWLRFSIYATQASPLIPQGPDGDSYSHTQTHRPQIWRESGGCPIGTVAIRRTTKDDILRRGVIDHFGKKRGGLFTVPQPENPDAMNIDGHEVNVSVWTFSG